MTSKNKFPDPKNLHVAIFKHEMEFQKWNGFNEKNGITAKWNSPEMELQHYFKTQEQNLPPVAKNSNCDNLKTTWGTQKKIFLFCVILF